MKKLYALPLLLALSVATFAQSPLQSLPITLVDGLIFIQLQVNDSKELTFLFDTGAGITVVDSVTARDLALPITGKSRIGTAARTLVTPSSENNTIRMGQATMSDVSIEVMQIGHFSDYFKLRIDGVIGYDLLNSFVVATNIDDRQMYLYDKDNFDYEGSAVPLELIELKSNQRGINLSLSTKEKKDISIPFKIDTAAANHVTVFNHTNKKYALLDEKKKHKTAKGFSADPTITSNYRGKLKSVSFGGRTWKKVPAVFVVDPLSIEASKDALCYGLLGQELLLDFNITYDYANALVYLEERK